MSRRMPIHSRSTGRIVLGLTIALFVVACTSSTTDTTRSSPADTETIASSTTIISTTTTLPESIGAYSDLAVGFTEEGHPRLGDPDAPVTLVEYSDYQCPFCGRHHAETAPELIERYAGPGTVNFVFRDFPLEDLHPNAPAGHAAALCVAEQDARLFWEYHDALFESQSVWADLPFIGPYLATTAEEIGADGADYQACIDSGHTEAAVERSIADVRSLGFSATPSFHVIDNRTGDTYPLVGAQPLAVFTSTLDSVIEGSAPPTTSAPEAPALPFWVSEEGLSPDPDRPGYTMGGDAYKGSPDAPLVVVEISDLQCPFCLRHTQETQPTLDQTFVETGRILWVFKHLPLPIHPQATDAAIAAECAGAQGAFWPMHDLLFDTVERWSVDLPGVVLTELANELGLDVDSFSACLDSRSALERVLSDMDDLSGVISSTPTFIIVREGRASVIEGAQPLESFVTFFDQLLEDE